MGGFFREETLANYLSHPSLNCAGTIQRVSPLGVATKESLPPVSFKTLFKLMKGFKKIQNPPQFTSAVFLQTRAYLYQTKPSQSTPFHLQLTVMMILTLVIPLTLDKWVTITIPIKTPLFNKHLFKNVFYLIFRN